MATAEPLPPRGPPTCRLATLGNSRSATDTTMAE
jgi:hypothetical protein